MTDTTAQAYGELTKAYDFFNGKLFNGKLPKCLITFQRKAKAYGYFCPDRFASADAICDEIAMNPSHFRHRSVTKTLSTLVHEMAHLEQAHFGKPSRGGYHNLEWAMMMERVGLYPSDTAQPGGKRSGPSMSHYIIESGVFDVACKDLLASGLTITWADAANEEERKKKAVTRAKYTCPTCMLNMWGKPDVDILCMACDEQMEEI